MGGGKNQCFGKQPLKTLLPRLKAKLFFGAKGGKKPHKNPRRGGSHQFRVGGKLERGQVFSTPLGVWAMGGATLNWLEGIGFPPFFNPILKTSIELDFFSMFAFRQTHFKLGGIFHFRDKTLSPHYFVQEKKPQKNTSFSPFRGRGFSPFGLKFFFFSL